MTDPRSTRIHIGHGPYIRFGYIPANEMSNIYQDGNIIGQEIGVSCYECLKINDKYRIIYPSFNDRWDKSAEILNILIKRFMLGNTKCFLITGDVVGRGTDNEPLLKNVKIIKELEKEDLTYDNAIL